MGNTCFVLAFSDVVSNSSTSSLLHNNEEFGILGGNIEMNNELTPEELRLTRNNKKTQQINYYKLEENKNNYDILLDRINKALLNKAYLNKRYMLYSKYKNKKYYRATLKVFYPHVIGESCYDQLIVYNSDENIDYNQSHKKYNFEKHIISMPLNFLSKIESLSDILLNKSMFPPEILDIIDEYW